MKAPLSKLSRRNLFDQFHERTVTIVRQRLEFRFHGRARVRRKRQRRAGGISALDQDPQVAVRLILVVEADRIIAALCVAGTADLRLRLPDASVLLQRSSSFFSVVPFHVSRPHFSTASSLVVMILDT